MWKSVPKGLCLSSTYYTGRTRKVVRQSFQLLDNPLNPKKGEKDMKQKVSEKIAQLRKDAQLTQQQLAEALNVSSAAVSKWENGISAPDIDTLCTLADYFHVSVDTLLGRAPNRGKVAVFLYDHQGEDICRKVIQKRGGEIAGVVYSIRELETLLASDKTIHRIIQVSLDKVPHQVEDDMDKLRETYSANALMSIVPSSEDVLGPLLERCLDVDPF